MLKNLPLPVTLLRIAVLVVIFTNITSARERLYPVGYSIFIKYNISTTIMTSSDTLEITRTLTNNEIFDLSGLYLSENLPPEFEVISSSMTINNNPIPFLYSGAIHNQVLSSYNAYRWVIDTPAGPDSISTAITAGQMLLLQYEIICDTPGNFMLPMHAACFYGDSTGFFTTSDTLQIIVLSENTIPTLSEWGLIILALLILVAGTVAIIRKRKTAIV